MRKRGSVTAPRRYVTQRSIVVNCYYELESNAKSLHSKNNSYLSSVFNPSLNL